MKPRSPSLFELSPQIKYLPVVLSPCDDPIESGNNPISDEDGNTINNPVELLEPVLCNTVSKSGVEIDADSIEPLAIRNVFPPTPPKESLITEAPISPSANEWNIESASMTPSSFAPPNTSPSPYKSKSSPNTPIYCEYSVSLSGEGAASMSLDPQNDASSSWFINASDSSMTTGMTLSYTASIQDAYGEDVVEYNREFVVGDAPSGGGSWYLYTSEPGQYATNNEATYLQIYGDTNDDGTPDAGYPFANLTGGDIGASSFTSTAYAGFGDTNTLVLTGSILSGSNTTPIVENLNHNGLGFMIVFPSSSGFTLPSSMTNALGGSTSGEYVLFSDRPGTGALNDNPQTSFVRYFDLDSGTYPGSSATRFGVIFVGPGSANITYFLMASSGSAPTSTQ